jgi:hypothetical protein
MPVQHYTEEDNPWVCAVLAHHWLPTVVSFSQPMSYITNFFIVFTTACHWAWLSFNRIKTTPSRPASLRLSKSIPHLILSITKSSFHSGFITKLTRNLSRLSYLLDTLTRKKNPSAATKWTLLFSPYTSPYNDSAGCSCILYFKSPVVKLPGIFQFLHKHIQKKFPHYH